MERTKDQVWKYISGVRSSLEKSNRYFPDDNSEFIEHLRWIFNNRAGTIKSNEVLYRGRIYTAKDKWDKYRNPQNYNGLDYSGYDSKESFVNLSAGWSAQGRMNPDGILCLYTAKDINTCINEIRPGYEELISIAEIKVLEDLKIVDLSKSFEIGSIEEEFRISLSLHIQELISQGGLSPKDYIFPQFIAECCKYMGYDGIVYRSKYSSRYDVGKDQGVNVTIFNYQKCTPVGSKLFIVEEVFVKSKEI